MGAWGIGNFENDDALDYLGTIMDEGGRVSAVEALLESLRKARDCGDVGVSLACSALVAAEVVAHAAGKGIQDSPEEVAEVARQWSPANEQLALAASAVARIATDSELSDLWQEEPGDFDRWAEILNDLMQRLGGPGF